MIKRDPIVLQVFISSPGDCMAQRDLIEATLNEVNASPEAQGADIVLKALRWEHLPPGATEASDYQRRIDNLLKALGLERFDIYLGLMSGRIGTPTPRYASGTIEEFETSLMRKRRTGMPAEVCFYFLGDAAAMPAEVAAFRSDLARRGFMYSDAAGPEQFHALLRMHLTHTVQGWRKWRNRIRRQLGHLKMISVALFFLAVVSWLVVDVTTHYQINQYLQQKQPEAAVRIWSARSMYFPITRLTLHEKIDSAFAEVAADRLIVSLSTLGYDPFRWKHEHLRPFEAKALTAYARRSLTSFPKHSGNASVLPLAVLAEDWSVLARLAHEQASQGRVGDLTEVRGLITYAPSPDVTVWLQQSLPAAMPTDVAAKILDAAAKRNEPVITFAVLEALRAGKLGPDAQHLDLSLACDKSQLLCAEPANNTLRRWLSDGQELPASALDLLLTWAVPGKLSPEQSAEIAQKILPLIDDKKYETISPVIISFLAQLGTPAAHTLLMKRIQEHIDGRISYGFAERKALIDAMRLMAPGKGRQHALEIARRSATEAAQLTGAFTPNDGGVQAAYLLLLAAGPQSDWLIQRQWIQQQIERRLRGEFMDLYLTGFDHALAALLPQLDATQFINLFGEPALPVVDTLDGALSSRRTYLLQLLADSSKQLPERMAIAVCRTIPALQSKRDIFYRTLALRGGAAGHTCLKRALSADATRYLMQADDIDSLLARLRTGRLSTPDFQALRETVAGLPPEQRRAFITAALPILPASEHQAYWPMASELQLNVPLLATAAITEIANSSAPQKLAAAFGYLGAVAPKRLWDVLRQPAITARITAIMGKADEFDWIQIAQVLPATTSPADIQALRSLLSSKKMLLILDATQVAPSAKLPDRLMELRSKVVGNPMLRLVAMHGGCEAARVLLETKNAGAGGLHTTGLMPGAEAAYIGFLDWLLADVLANTTSPSSCTHFNVEHIAWLDDSDPVAGRAAAGLVLASKWRAYDVVPAKKNIPK